MSIQGAGSESPIRTTITGTTEGGQRLEQHTPDHGTPPPSSDGQHIAQGSTAGVPLSLITPSLPSEPAQLARLVEESNPQTHNALTELQRQALAGNRLAINSIINIAGGRSDMAGQAQTIFGELRPSFERILSSRDTRALRLTLGTLKQLAESDHPLSAASTALLSTFLERLTHLATNSIPVIKYASVLCLGVVAQSNTAQASEAIAHLLTIATGEGDDPTSATAAETLVSIASGETPQAALAKTSLGNQLERLGALAHHADERRAEAALAAINFLALGGDPFATPAQAILRRLERAPRRLSGLTIERERELLGNILERLAPSEVDLNNVLKPLDASETALSYAPRENMADDRNWDLYAQKMGEIIRNLPATLLGIGEAAEQKRQHLMRMLVAASRDDQSWLQKIMETAEAQNPAGKISIRTQVATAINYLQSRQRAGGHGEVLSVLDRVLFYADACPDRATFGVNALALATRLGEHMNSETNPDKRCLKMVVELVQQAKLNFVRTELTASYGGLGEALEGYLRQCLYLKDVLGLPITMNDMLYPDLGGVFAGHNFEGDLRRVLTRLSNPEDFLAFLATPPEDAGISKTELPWAKATTAPAELATAGEVEYDRLLQNSLRPMLQALGFLKAPNLAELQANARSGNPEAIKILYWQAIADNNDATRFLQNMPLDGLDFASLGLLAKTGNEQARHQLENQCTEIAGELRHIDEATEPTLDTEARRNELINKLVRIAGYGVNNAMEVLRDSGSIDEIWQQAEGGNPVATELFKQLAREGNRDALSIIRNASTDGKPLALMITQELQTRTTPEA